MKKLLYTLVFGLLTLLPFTVSAQQGVKSQKFTIAGPGGAINLINTAIAWHQITWNVSGTASACTVALDTSANGTTWSAGGAITGQTCTSNGSSSVVNVSANYVRVDMTALTVSAGGSVTVTWDGWVTDPSGGGGGGSVTGCSTSGGVAYENGTANTLTCGAQLVWDSVNNILTTNILNLGTVPYTGPENGALNVAVTGTDPGSGLTAGFFSTTLTGPATSGGSAAITSSAVSSGANNLFSLNSLELSSDHASTGTLDFLVGLQADLFTDPGAGVVTSAVGEEIDSPVFAGNGVTTVNGQDIQDQCGTANGSIPATNCRAIYIEAQTSPGYGLYEASASTPNVFGTIKGASLIVTGVLDGTVPVTKTTGTSATLGAGTYSSGYTMNQEGTAGTGVTYTLPATVLGMQYCVANSGTTSVINTGVLTVYPPSGSYVILAGVVNTIGGGGTHGVASGGAAGDGACFVAIDSTHWQVYVQSGTWAEN